MERREFLKIMAAAAPFVLIPGCAKVPYTGRTQLMLISAQEELSLGHQAAEEIRRKEKLTQNKKYTRPVTQVGKNIARVANKPSFRWSFEVVANNKVANAFCLPGGKIFVYTGLFKYIANRSELATVIAHEVGHAVARHGAERMSTSLVAQVGQQAAMIALGDQSPAARQAFAMAFGIGANVGLILPFSRQQEYEADHIGLILMAKAGYDPRAAVSFWEKMSKQNKGKNPPAYLSTHPSNADRIAEIKRLLPEAMHYYQKRQ